MSLNSRPAGDELFISIFTCPSAICHHDEFRECVTRIRDRKRMKDPRFKFKFTPGVRSEAALALGPFSPVSSREGKVQDSPFLSLALPCLALSCPALPWLALPCLVPLRPFPIPLNGQPFSFQIQRRQLQLWRWWLKCKVDWSHRWNASLMASSTK